MICYALRPINDGSELCNGPFDGSAFCKNDMIFKLWIYCKKLAVLASAIGFVFSGHFCTMLSKNKQKTFVIGNRKEKKSKSHFPQPGIKPSQPDSKSCNLPRRYKSRLLPQGSIIYHIPNCYNPPSYNETFACIHANTNVAHPALASPIRLQGCHPHTGHQM